MVTTPILLPWLVIAAAMAFSLIVLGGVVRLTHAGLSITEWQPVAGVLPPMDDLEWNLAFDKYRATPEYMLVNTRVDMEGFRTLFLLEYAHRLLGRVTGLVLALPLALLLLRRKLSLHEAGPIAFVLSAGLVQAGLGWLMVKSGLVDVPHVSPRRLAAHLVVGVAVFAALVWMISAQLTQRVERAPSARTLGLGYATLTIAAVTVAWGGLMAGTHAGLIFTTFPKMGGAWVPIDLASLSHTTSDPVVIHFVHRAAALALSIACIALVTKAWRTSSLSRVLSTLTLIILVAQVVLGALVVVRHVPLALASVHQANAVLLVGLIAALVCQLSRQRRLRAGPRQSRRVDIRHRPDFPSGGRCAGAARTQCDEEGARDWRQRLRGYSRRRRAARAWLRCRGDA